MNILIPHSWLKEFVKTDAAPETIAEKLSLCSLSVEKLHRKGSDTVYEIEITPNRYDTLSVLGIAREVAAVLPQFDIKAELVSIDTTDTIDATDADLLDVTITNPELCPRFTAIILDHVEIKPSPKLVRDRLEKSGIRALNNVVDVSNYLMLELGQPMHIFDFDKIADERRSGGRRLARKEMILRESKKGEKLTTLDGIERELPKGAIVIESGGRLIDLCGIMGGKNSEVGENTKRILLFLQIYDPVRIRKTSQTLGLRTEASARFEKGIDPEGVIPAMNRAIEMLKENANARIASSLTDIKNEIWQPHEVELEIPQVEQLLGVRIEKEEIINILKSLGFEVRVKNSALQIPTITASVPSWRDKDIQIAADLIEEVARLYGYHNIPNLMPEGAIPPVPREKRFHWEDKAKDFLKHQGFCEAYNYSFVSEEQLRSYDIDPKTAIRVKNPLNRELEYLRPSLLPSLMQNLEENKNHADEIKLFELERVYQKKKGQKLPDENFRLTGALRSKIQNPTSNFYTLKGMVEGLLRELGIAKWNFQPDAIIRVNSTPIGLIGLIGPIVYFDLDFDAITELASDQKTYEPIPEYPPIIEDLSVIVDKKTHVREIVNRAEKHSKKSLKISAKITDIYQDKKLEKEDKKSVTLRLTYQAKDRTLTDREVHKIRQKIITALEKNLSAKVRQK